VNGRANPSDEGKFQDSMPFWKSHRKAANGLEKETQF
jgi:hypothetical protein